MSTAAALSLVPHAVVLCGAGGGPGLSPLPGPPALLPIGNEAALGFLLRALEGAGVRSAMLMAATDAVASKLSAWVAKHWQAGPAGAAPRLSLTIRTSPPNAGSGGALAAALTALDLPPGSPVVVTAADLVTEDAPLARAFLAHFRAGALVTALLAHRRTSPASETKPGRAPRGVDYVALAGGGGGGGRDGGGPGANALAPEPALLHLALGPADPAGPPAREVALPLAALAAAAAAASAASASAPGGGRGAGAGGALTLRSDLAAAGCYVLDAGGAAAALATLADRAGGACPLSLGRDVVPYLLRRQFTPRPAEEGGEDGGGGGGGHAAPAARPPAPQTPTPPGAPSSAAASTNPRPVCQATIAPRGTVVCARAHTAQAFLDLNRDVAAADASFRAGGVVGGGGGGPDGAPSSTTPPPTPSGAPAAASIHPTVTLGTKAAVSPGCIVGPDCALGDRAAVKKSVLGPGVVLGKGAKVTNSVLLAGCVVGEGATVQNAVLCAGASVGDRAVVRDAKVGPGHAVAEGDEVVDETVGGGAGVNE